MNGVTKEMKSILSDFLFIFPLGAAGYCLLEVLWRGYTHWTMALAGGICFCCIYAIFCVKKRKMLLQCLLCALVVTCVEFIFGCIVNLFFHMNIWDYSYLPFQFLGQVCLPYTALWFLLSIPLSALCGQLNAVIRKLEQLA